jgi:O-succinylbenzoic acid--CoA ligase
LTALQGSTPDWLRQRAAISPDRVALITEDLTATYAQLDAAVDGYALLWLDNGFQPGDVVGILPENGSGFVLLVHTLARIGAISLPMNTRLTGDELSWQLKDAGARWLFRSPRFRGEPRLAAFTRGENSFGLARWVDADPQDRTTRIASRRFDLSAAHSVLYTSGTTGRPKGAVLTYGNHLWSATASALNLGLQPDDRWLACLPLFHVGGLSILLRSVIYGTAAVVHPGFDAARVNAAIDNERVTIVSVVANMLQRMLDEREDRPYPPALRCVLLGGGPAPEPLLRRCAASGVPVVQTYGLTETASQIATLAPEDALRKLGSAGKPLFGSELRIVTEDGSDCPAGVDGEIVVRGPTVTPGYLNHPGETAAAIRDGWLHTGDAGRLDAEGYLYVLDRRDDLIVSGGENVYPAEIEAVLQSHPDVVEAGVYAVDDERWGKTPAAVVVLRPGASSDAAALITHCRERLAAYKTPARIDFTDALPRNASGKLLRRELPGARPVD